jgi:hypothetical protein
MQASRQRSKQAGREASRQAGRQAIKWTERQTKCHLCLIVNFHFDCVVDFQRLNQGSLQLRGAREGRDGFPKVGRVSRRRHPSQRSRGILAGLQDGYVSYLCFFLLLATWCDRLLLFKQFVMLSNTFRTNTDGLDCASLTRNEYRLSQK